MIRGTGTRRLTDRISLWLDAAITQHAPQEDITFDLDLKLQPGERGEPTPFVAVYVFMPGAVLGSHVFLTLGMGNPPALTEKDIEGTVIQLLEQLRAARSRQLATGDGDLGQTTVPIREPGQ